MSSGSSRKKAHDDFMSRALSGTTQPREEKKKSESAAKVKKTYRISRANETKLITFKYKISISGNRVTMDELVDLAIEELAEEVAIKKFSK